MLSPSPTLPRGERGSFPSPLGRARVGANYCVIAIPLSNPPTLRRGNCLCFYHGNLPLTLFSYFRHLSLEQKNRPHSQGARFLYYPHLRLSHTGERYSFPSPRGRVRVGDSLSPFPLREGGRVYYCFTLLSTTSSNCLKISFPTSCSSCERFSKKLPLALTCSSIASR